MNSMGKINSRQKYILNEDFSSAILRQMAIEHGGIKVYNNGGRRESNSAWVRGRDTVPVSRITDDMIVGGPYKYDGVDLKDWNRLENVVLFNDGYAVQLRSDIDLPNRKSYWEKAGVPDTGNHNRKPGNPRNVSASFNGMTQDAMDARGYREALGFNKSVADDYRSKGDRRGEWAANDNIRDLRSRVEKLRNKRMKQRVKLTESDLHRIITESVKRVLNEHYNQFDDSDFASTGNPYDLENDGENRNSLDGYYGSFNNIDVWIWNDGKEDACVKVEGFYNGNKKIFNGQEANEILDRIRKTSYEFGKQTGALNAAIYRVLYPYVL